MGDYLMNTTNKKQIDANKMTFDDFDKLNLKGFAENLFQNMEKGTVSSIGDQEGAYTISLNAEFGNGKTTFLQMFEHFIKTEKQNYNVFSINVWESDFYKEPVIAILSELANYMKENSEGNKAKIIETIGKIAINIGSQVIQAKTGVRLKEIKDSLEAGNTILKDFNQRKEAIKEIKTALKEYTKDKKLLIIVDELDRTKPDYAVHFLEDMKHFFDIENIVFLVAVNKKQMEATVKCLFGEMDFNGYYKKFFKQEMDLPYPYKEAQRFVDNLIQKTTVKYYYKEEKGNLLNPISRETRVQNSYLSCRMFNLTLREIEYFMRIFEKILGSKNKISRWILMDCYSFFICLFMKEKKVFNKILNGNFTIGHFFQFVDQKEFKYVFDTTQNTRIEYKNNYLLGTIACSFISNQDSLLKNREKIEGKFKAIGNVNNLFQFQDTSLGTREGFTLEHGQPTTINICETIDRCKAVFNE